MRRYAATFLAALLAFGWASGAALARAGARDDGRATAISRHEQSHANVHAAPAGRARAPRRGRRAPAVASPGLTQRGHASVYASRLAGRRMANGGRFDPRSDTVASRTLPLGARVRVTNLRTGRSAVAHVRDRGPSARRRILDLSPGLAARLGMGRTGTAPVAVTLLPGLSTPAEAAPRRR
ncbi:hypothetical protein EAH89_18430 [Roseomonas nepalensis]|uniref:Endolytic peptidoglycan transglycosylase RlpA n=1 Tax=Muricoccus nepalensis TaxID=1854500 RepID=A0A502FTR1_9PROT|nr:septal ring lytic transglycosylase RlpA family protein [Roseomonas nepalensis]TPG52363.1 hypothetical protein EAH89_18430 [Roseomonas nepalensis]